MIGRVFHGSKEHAPMSRRFSPHPAEPKAAKGDGADQARDRPIRDIGVKEPRPTRLITRAELCRIVPYTPQHILRLEKRGMFPRRVQLGANRVAWLLSEIEEWVEARVAERDKSNP